MYDEWAWTRHRYATASGILGKTIAFPQVSAFSSFLGSLVTKFSVRIYGTVLWNSLGIELQDLPTLTSFKKKLVQTLLENL